MGGDWRTLVKVERGIGRWVGMVDRYVELRNFKGVRTMQLYSTKRHSHPTVYVYSKRFAESWATTAYRGTLEYAYSLLRTPAQATAPSGRTRSPNIQCVPSSFEFENHLWYISARYHEILCSQCPVKVNASLWEVTKFARTRTVETWFRHGRRSG